MSEFLALRLSREILHLQNKEIKQDIVPKCFIVLCNQYFLNLMNTILNISELTIDDIKPKLLEISQQFDDIRNEWQDLFILYDKIQREKDLKYTKITYFHVLYAIYLLVYLGSNEKHFTYFQQVRGCLKLYNHQFHHNETFIFNDEHIWNLMHTHNFKSKLPEKSINALTVYTLTFAIPLMVKEVARKINGSIPRNAEHSIIRALYKMLQTESIFQKAFDGCKISFQVQYHVT